MKRKLLIWVIAAAVAGGCGTKRKSADKDRGDQEKPTDDQANPLDSLGMMGSLLSSRLEQPGPYDEPRTSPGYDQDAPHFAVLELAGKLVELNGFSWFGGQSGIELRAVDARLRELAADDNVTGLLLRVGDLEANLAIAEELRAALIRFKSAGGRQRKLLCHTEGVANTTYFVMTACDSIGLAPTGEVVVSGVSAMPLHLKGLLDQLGIQADFLHIGAFKGAAEPLTRDRPSPEMVATLDAIMDRAYQTLVDGIAQGRQLDPTVVRRLIDTAMFQGQTAVTDGLVDEVAVYESYRDQALGDAAWTVVKLEKERKPDMTSLMRFIGILPQERPSEPHVAVVYAVGNVIDGKGGGILGAREEIASRTLAAAFRALAADDSVKAIVFRIDSGGGSALASEIIWHAVAEARAKKPVVVSMGNVAASGGYYIACGATKIFASDNTLTGSIGVVGGKLAIAGALAKIGIKSYPMGRGKRALMWSSLGPWSDDERAAIKEMMEGVYHTFVDRVATGRDKTPDQIDAIAQGRVWTGADALAKGLVDEIGGLDAALAEARKLGEVDPEVGLEVYPPEPTLLDFVNSLGQSSLPLAMSRTVTEVAAQVGGVEAAVVSRTLRQLLLLRQSPVLAAWLFPVVIR